MYCSHRKKNYGNMSIEKLSPFHVKKIWKWSKSTLTWKKNGNLPVGHPCPIAKGLGDAMREILDFCIFISKTELWKYTARRDADFYRPMPNLW
jgi:hypothetical protein